MNGRGTCIRVQCGKSRSRGQHVLQPAVDRLLSGDVSKVVFEWVSLLLRIQEVSCSYLSPETVPPVKRRDRLDAC
jgi:hypothetical protein